jgi:phosphoribosylanthranilate isomerase
MAVSGIQVKICGIRNADDARFVQECGADFVGMIHFEKSPRHVTLDQIRAILPAIEAGRSVAVMVEPENHEIEFLLEAGVDHFQIHVRSDSLERIRQWASLVTRSRLWLASKLPPGEPFPVGILQYADTILIDTYSSDKWGGTGETGDWKGFRELSSTYTDTRFILAGGLNPSNIRNALEISGSKFIDLVSGVESQPGVKDRGKIEELFSQLKLNSGAEPVG